MSLGTAYWIVMLIWTIAAGGWFWSSKDTNWPQVAGAFIPWLLFVLVGWQVFGAPLHG